MDDFASHCANTAASPNFCRRGMSLRTLLSFHFMHPSPGRGPSFAFSTVCLCFAISLFPSSGLRSHASRRTRASDGFGNPVPQRTAANNSWYSSLPATTGATVLEAATVATAGATGTSELLEAAPESTACDCWLFPFTAFPASAGAAEGPAFAAAAELPASAGAAGAAALAADADVLLSTGAAGTECSWHARQIECQRGSPATDIMKVRISARNKTLDVKDRVVPSAMHKASSAQSPSAAVAMAAMPSRKHCETMPDPWTAWAGIGTPA